MQMNQGQNFVLNQIDPEIAAALDPEELEELQAQLMQGMGQQEFEEWSDEDEVEEGQNQNGFIQNFINNFNQWRGQNNGAEEEKKE